MSPWASYVKKVTGTENQSKIAKAMTDKGVKTAQSTVGRWFTGAEPTVTSVVEFADCYGLDYTDAFLHAAAKAPGDSEPVYRASTGRVKGRGRSAKSQPEETPPTHTIVVEGT